MADDILDRVIETIASIDGNTADVHVGIATLDPKTQARIGVGDGAEAFLRRDLNIGGLDGNLDIGIKTNSNDHGFSGNFFDRRSSDYIAHPTTRNEASVWYEGSRKIGETDSQRIYGGVTPDAAYVGTEWKLEAPSLDTPGHDVDLMAGADVTAGRDGTGAIAYAGVRYSEDKFNASGQVQVIGNPSAFGVKSYGSNDTIVAAVRGDLQRYVDSDNRLSVIATTQFNSNGDYNVEVGLQKAGLFSVNGMEVGSKIYAGYDSARDQTGLNKDGLGATAGGQAYVDAAFTIK